MPPSGFETPFRVQLAIGRWCYFCEFSEVGCSSCKVGNELPIGANHAQEGFNFILSLWPVCMLHGFNLFGIWSYALFGNLESPEWDF